MKHIFLTVLITISLDAACQLPDQTIRDLKAERIKDDTSYIYRLPYPASERHLFVQGANSKFSHRSELAFDFKMKEGSHICAVRNGEVIAIKEDSNQGGLKNEYLNDGNHIIVRHDDGSLAHYWHLKQNGVFVKVGERVEKGQKIGLSGNTGYSAFAHLHFKLIDKYGNEILPRFQTKKGPRYLRPGKWYKAVTD